MNQEYKEKKREYSQLVAQHRNPIVLLAFFYCLGLVNDGESRMRVPALQMKSSEKF